MASEGWSGDNAVITANGGSVVGTLLTSILLADDIQPGSQPSYELCKLIYTLHPLGAKMVETPVKLAQTKPRVIAIEGVACEKELIQQFERTRKSLQIDYFIRGVAFRARTYGAGVLACGEKTESTAGMISGQSWQQSAPNTDTPLDLWKIKADRVYFSAFDPLNVAGSLVLDLNPNSPMYLKPGDIAVSSQKWHRSRTVPLFNEQPDYLSYTTSAFGFNGRSVYQRALFPLKSFIQTMITDDMVTRKAGLLVAAIKAAGSIVNNLMQKFAGIKRFLLKSGNTGNVLSIEPDERIESINLENIDKAMVTARGNVVKNIATAGDMPAIILEQETFAEGFGEGTEDTKNVIRYVDEIRTWLEPLYDFTDPIVMHLAWSEEFFETLKADHPGLFDGKNYREVFYTWKRGFQVSWPNLLEEPDSEKSKTEKVKEEALTTKFELLFPHLDPENKGILVQWLVDNTNENQLLFRNGLDLDMGALQEHFEQQKQQQDEMAAAGMVGMNGDDQEEGGNKDPTQLTGKPPLRLAR